VSPFDELADGVYRRRYESLDLNIGVILGEAAVLVVDSRASHRQADELRAELESLTKLPVAWVVNTHYHWDHTWGNARFPEATLWGHVLCRSEMLEHGEEARQRVLDSMPPEHHDAINEVVITPPTETFTAESSIDLGNRIVDLAYHGRGHTNSDIVVTVRDAGVVFAGDLIEEGAPPSFGDAYPLEWAPTLRGAGLAGTIVPGHGDIVAMGFAETQREELAYIAALAHRGHQADAPVSELIGDGPYPAATMEIALTRAYAQLDGDLD
jgi:glyoxylase-like metal-dependent hydrolase (beta-lactamase superfamily II)